MEVSCVVTDGQLNLVAEHETQIIYYPEHELQLNDWCAHQHTKSGLLAAILASKTTLKGAESLLVGFLERFTEPRQAIIAGNSVHFDKMFLDKYDQ